MKNPESTRSGAHSGLAGSSGVPQELAVKIERTEEEVDDVKKEIKGLKQRLIDGNFEGDVRYSSSDKVEAALLRLEAEKARLQGLLLTYENQKLAAQQQSGAGASRS